MERFRVKSMGRLRPGIGRQQAIGRLQRVFKRPQAQLERLLDTPLVVGYDLGAQQAQQVLRALRNSGLEAEGQLQAERELFIGGLCAPRLRREEAPPAPPSLFHLPLKGLAASLTARPHREGLRADSRTGGFDVVNHRWWISPVFAILLALLAAPILQRYLLEIAARQINGPWLMPAGVLLLLFSLRRLISLHAPGEAEPELILHQQPFPHPLQRRYRVQHVEGEGALQCPRYGSGSGEYYEEGTLAFYMEKNPDSDEVMREVANGLRANVAGFDYLEDLMQWVKEIFGRRVVERGREPWTGAKLVFAIRNSDGEQVALAWRAGDGGIRLNHGLLAPEQISVVLIMALVGMGVG